MVIFRKRIPRRRTKTPAGSFFLVYLATETKEIICRFVTS